MAEVADVLKRRLDSQQAEGRTLTLKVKYADYQQVTRSRTLMIPIRDRSLILDIAQELLDMTDVEYKAVRLLGSTVSNLVGEAQEQYVQLYLNV